jgi:A/G-specific adenine glycosylase
MPPRITARPSASQSPGNGVHRHWPGGTWKARLRRRLLAWFDRHQRELPWRGTRDPYRVWISEIMLQQTQVMTVIPYFNRFLAQFPTLADLAAAEERQVLRLWEGLGYYRRARQLHRAARICMAEHGGRFPETRDAALALPGIGRYTAGAILSIAFDQRQPIVEANTVRVYSRLLASRESPHGTTGQRMLWSAAEELLPAARPGDFNQALMELGAIVCLPEVPRCDDCPVALLCPTRAAGLQAAIPAPKPRPRTTAVREAAVVVRRGPRVLLVCRDDGGRWAGLWDFPRFPITAAGGAALRTELAQRTLETCGQRIDPGMQLATLTHGVTRFRIALSCHEARWLAGRAGRRAGAITRWFRADELAALPMNVTGRKLTRFVTAPPP